MGKKLFKNPLKKAAEAGVVEILKEGSNLIDVIFTSEEEKLEARQKYFDKIVSDRQNARSMYESDSILQKIFAITFLLAWVILTWFLLQHFALRTIELADWQIAFIGTLYGGINIKLSTIIDFLFGGSSQQTKKD